MNLGLEEEAGRLASAVREDGLDGAANRPLSPAANEKLQASLRTMRAAALDGRPANARMNAAEALEVLRADTEEAGWDFNRLDAVVTRTLDETAARRVRQGEEPARFARTLLESPSTQNAALQGASSTWAARRLADLSMPRTFTSKTLVLMLLGASIQVLTYPYLVLKAGIASGISISSAFLAFALQKLTSRSGRVDVRETNQIQTFIAASGYVSFMVVVLAAMDMLGILPPNPWLVGLWLATLAVLGTWMVVPFRHQMLEVEKLPFPDGAAVGELLLTLEDPTGASAAQTKSLGLAAGIAVFFVVIKDWLRWIPALFANEFRVGFEPSTLLMGAGAIIGQESSGRKTLFWACATALVTWVLAAPWMVSSGLAQEVAGIFGTTKALANRNYYPVLMSWTMWPATMLMVAHGLTALALNWRQFRDSFMSLQAAAKGFQAPQKDVPLKPLLAGILALTALLGWLQHVLFGISPLISALGVLVSIPLMMMGMRVKGLSGIGPVSIIGSVVQLVFGFIAPGNLPVNMATSASGATIAGTSEAEGDEFRAGAIVGNHPRTLVIIQSWAMPFATMLLGVVSYPVVKTIWGFGENGLPAPTAHKWQGLAQILNKGAAALPHSSIPAMEIAIAAGILLALLETRTQKTRWAFWTPSCTGIGLAMLLPASIMFSMAAGALIAWLLGRSWSRSRSFVVPTAAGLIVGDAMTSLAGGVLRVAGLLR